MWQRTSFARLAGSAGSLGPMLLALCLLAGCQGPQLMPTPNVYVQAPSNPFADVAPSLRTNTVDVLYTTDRQPIPQDDRTLAYGSGRSPSLAVGSCVVEMGQNVSWDTLAQQSQLAERSEKLPLRIRAMTEQVRFPVTRALRIDERVRRNVRRNVMNKDSIFSRRRFLQISGAGILGMELLRSGGNFFLTPEIRAAEVTSPMTSEEALKELLAGNKRFVQSIKDSCVQRTPDRHMEVAEGQNPFAVILACADSRVAPEIIFDQWIGDLFVVRVAGNIVSPENYGILGSIALQRHLFPNFHYELPRAYLNPLLRAVYDARARPRDCAAGSIAPSARRLPP